MGAKWDALVIVLYYNWKEAIDISSTSRKTIFPAGGGFSLRHIFG
jgi:hypothetical protein